MPKVYRVMKKDADGKPALGSNASSLGVRVGRDIDVDPQGRAIRNEKGMSVGPSWRQLNLFLIPRRLGTGGRGRDTCFCFRFGEGAFEPGDFAAGLELVPDSAVHAVVRPVEDVPLIQYEADLHATRDGWQIDEA